MKVITAIKQPFLLQTTYGEENYGEEFTPDATYGLTVPNGFYLAQRFGNGQITGKWTTFNFGTKITQPAYVMNFEYDYFPTDYTITYNLMVEQIIQVIQVHIMYCMG